MNGCVYKLPDGRCDKPGRYLSPCIGEACQHQTPSNYDQIISYTPEELANFFGELTNNGDFALCPDSNCTCGLTGCAGCWLEWLKSPVEVDE